MKFTLRPSFWLFIAFGFFASSASVSGAAEPTLEGVALSAWASVATGTELARMEYAPEGLSGSTAVPTVIYLLNLAAPRVGTDSDEAIIADFVAAGMVVITLDYAGDRAARVPSLNPDIQKLRRDVLFNAYPTTHPIDQRALFIIPSGHRLQRNVAYEVTGFGRGIDIMYPSNPGYPAGAIMAFSCDNKDRMGNGSFYAIRDTIFEGMATEGFAVAMADHPQPNTYNGIDPMPASARRVKAAVRTLRAQTENLGLSGEIAVMGFSRGSGMALMAVTTAETSEFDGFYENTEVDASVQGALILSGRFTYLDLLPTDKNITKYRSFWGDPVTRYDVWKAQGALDYLESAPPFPIFLSLNAGEAVDDGRVSDAMHQMTVIQNRLDAFDADYTFMLEEEFAGHKMPLDPLILREISAYFKARLRPSPEAVLRALRFDADHEAEASATQFRSTVAVPMADYQLESSTNLESWTMTAPLHPETDGTLRFEVPDASTAGALWFRVSSGQAETSPEEKVVEEEEVGGLPPE